MNTRQLSTCFQLDFFFFTFFVADSFICYWLKLRKMNRVQHGKNWNLKLVQREEIQALRSCKRETEKQLMIFIWVSFLNSLSSQANQISLSLCHSLTVSVSVRDNNTRKSGLINPESRLSY